MRTKKKIISLLVITIMISCMILPVFAQEVKKVSEGRIYTFHSVNSGEDLSGKKFIVVGDYEETYYGGGGSVAAEILIPNPTLNTLNTNNQLQNSGPSYLQVAPRILERCYPTLTDNNEFYDGYTNIWPDEARKINDDYCFSIPIWEWTFEKNEDGTYSLYLEDDYYGDRYYLYSEGSSPTLLSNEDGKAKYVLEYKEDGKIALRFSSFEGNHFEVTSTNPPGGTQLFSAPGAPNDNYIYVTYDPDSGYFKSGSANDIHTLRLYENDLEGKGVVSYKYDRMVEGLNSSGKLGNEPAMGDPIQVIGSTETPALTVENTNSNGAFSYYPPAEAPYLEDLFNKQTEDADSFKDPSPKSSKIWGAEIEQIGWVTGNIRGDVVVLNTDAKFRYEKSTDTIKTTDINGEEVALYNMSELYAIYTVKSENIFFDIEYKDLDLDDGTLIAEDVSTESLAVGHVYYSTNKTMNKIKELLPNIPTNMLAYWFMAEGGIIHPATLEYYEHMVNNEPYDPEEELFIDVNKALIDSYDPSRDEDQVVIEGLMTVEPTTLNRVSYTPAAGQSLNNVVDHAMDYITEYSDELSVQDMENVNDYDVVWYGTTQRNEGPVVNGVMRNMKNFLVIDASFEDINENEIPVDDFKIEILNNDGDVLRTLTLKDDSVTVSPDKQTYSWKLNDMTEDTYTIKQYNRKTGEYIPSTNASTDVDTNVGDVSEDGDNDVVTFKISTINNHKDQVKLVNKYTKQNGEKPHEDTPAPSGGSAPAAGGGGGPVAQAIQSIYNGLLPKTGSASAVIITVLGIIIIAIAIRLRHKDNKKDKKEQK